MTNQFSFVSNGVIMAAGVQKFGQLFSFPLSLKDNFPVNFSGHLTLSVKFQLLFLLRFKIHVSES